MTEKIEKAKKQNGGDSTLAYKSYEKLDKYDYSISFERLGISMDDLQEIGNLNYIEYMADKKGNEVRKSREQLIVKMNDRWYVVLE